MLGRFSKYDFRKFWVREKSYFSKNYLAIIFINGGKCDNLMFYFYQMPMEHHNKIGCIIGYKMIPERL